MTKAEHEHDEVARKEAKLKEWMASQLKDKNDMFIKERARATMARMEHSEN